MNNRRCGLACLLVLSFLVPATSLAVRGDGADVERISVAADGAEPDGRSELPMSNGDGSVIAFKSHASNLIASDTNGAIDVYLYDRVTGVIERIPRRPDTESDPEAGSFPPVLSDDGRFVAFGSAARNLTRGDFNLFPDMYLYDRATEQMRNLSLVLDINNEGRLGGQVPDLPGSISADGRFVAFTAASRHLSDNDFNDTHDVYVYDRDSDTIEVVSLTNLGTAETRTANDLSGAPVLSPEGDFVVFCSEASNLTVGGDDDVAGFFLRDRGAQSTIRLASLSPGNCLQREFLAAVSGGAGVVALASDMPLVPSDANGLTDIYAYVGGELRLISAAVDGGSGNGSSSFASVSGDGRFIVFQSSATNLVDVPDDNGATDIFVADLTDGRIERITGNGDAIAVGDSVAPVVSRDGRVIIFQSDAVLTDDDTNGLTDIFSTDNDLSYTPTPTHTATLGPTDTPTPVPVSPTPVPPTVPPTDTPLPDPTATDTPVPPSGTPTATHTPVPTDTPITRTPIFVGGDSDGCGCRIDPETGQIASSLPIMALLPPALLLGWRRREELLTK